MPIIVHLSDLHFGSHIVQHLDEILVKEIETLRPDAVVVSGDFTLRAQPLEYVSARGFLDKIKFPTLAIPGNHDQPLFAPVERLTTPYARYQKYICPMLDVSLSVNGLFALGLSDCRPILPGGFWSREQRFWIQNELAGAPRGAIKIIATHHQFLWDGKWRPAGFWYPTRALEWLAGQGVEMMLNGHTHVPIAEQVASGIVVSRAGTATSSRIRNGWGNTYNVVVVDRQRISVSVRQYDPPADAYLEVKAYQFPRRGILN